MGKHVNHRPRIECYADMIKRCTPDDVSGCMLYVSKTGRARRSETYKGVDWQPARLAWALSGHDLPHGAMLHRLPCCQHAACINPAHRAIGGLSDAQQAAVARGSHLSPAARQAARKGCMTLAVPADTVAKILADLDRGMTPEAAGKAHGVHRSTVYRMRDGQHITQRDQAVRGASAFTWRP